LFGDADDLTTVREVRITVREKREPGRPNHEGKGGESEVSKEPRPKPVGEKESAAKGFPQVLIEAWDSPVRSMVRTVGEVRQVVVNKQHPAYSATNARYMIAECVLAEVLGLKHESTSEFRSELDQFLGSWASSHASGEPD
jgi:hypothetical protein